MRFNIHLIFFLFISVISDISGQDCNLNYLTTIEESVVYIDNTSGAILFRAKIAIDADGSPRAYGPNNSGLDWTANAGSPGNWWGIVTNSSGQPIIQGSNDPFPGMYVSTTSLVQSGISNTNPLRYVDSENISFIALPASLQSLANIAKGDLVYAKNITNGNTCFAYFVDTGPGGKLGEGSMKFADLLEINSNPRTGGTNQAIIDYVVFPQSGQGQGIHLTTEEIEIMGQTELDNAGSEIMDCLDEKFPSLDCSFENTIKLDCGIEFHGQSSSKPSYIDNYGCNNWSESGPERIHSFIPINNGILTASLSNFDGDLDVYILGSCDPFDCLGTVSSYSATFENAIAGKTYFIVVDADDGSGSTYDITVDCILNTNTITITKTNDIKLYPNPTTGVISIDLNELEIREIEVLDIFGKHLETIEPNSTTINLEKYAIGLYFLKIVNSHSKTTVLKIVKK